VSACTVEEPDIRATQILQSSSIVNGGVTLIEAAHTNARGPKRMGQKTPDFSAIPCQGSEDDPSSPASQVSEFSVTAK
jgi:hypothetical protein